MTNKEILQASLPDIVFHNRNQDYGTYELRLKYPFRLWTAFSITIILMPLLFIFISFAGKKKSHTFIAENEQLFLSRIIEFPSNPPPSIIPPEVSPAKPAVVPPAPTIGFNVFNIVPDPEVQNILPAMDELSGKIISNIDSDNEKGNNPHSNIGNISGTSGTNQFETDPPQPQNEMVFSRSGPEFPGLRAALENFLHRHLRICDELQLGDKKTVQVKCKITP
jgi:hypothetical protein